MMTTARSFGWGTAVCVALAVHHRKSNRKSIQNFGQILPLTSVCVVILGWQFIFPCSAWVPRPLKAPHHHHSVPVFMPLHHVSSAAACSSSVRSSIGWLHTPQAPRRHMPPPAASGSSAKEELHRCVICAPALPFR